MGCLPDVFTTGEVRVTVEGGRDAVWLGKLQLLLQLLLHLPLLLHVVLLHAAVHAHAVAWIRWLVTTHHPSSHPRHGVGVLVEASGRGKPAGGPLLVVNVIDLPLWGVSPLPAIG